jgi:hypothetical protein
MRSEKVPPSLNIEAEFPRMVPTAVAPIAALAATLGLSAAASAAEPPAVDPAIRTGERATRDAAFIIGNEAYTALPQATWAQQDADSFQKWAELTRGVHPRRRVALTNADARTMYKWLRRMRRRPRPGGTVWVYFAGHATLDNDGKHVLLGTDASSGQLAGLTVEGIADQFARNRRVERIVLVVDAGIGATGRGGFELVPGRSLPEAAPLQTDPRVVVWTAETTPVQPQLYAPARHGLFTWSVLGAMRGWADGELDGETDGKVTLGEAQSFVARAPTLLGRVASPSVDGRTEVRDWGLAQGSYLEPTPADNIFEALAVEDTQARLRAAEERIREDAAAFWADTLALAQQGGPEGKAALEAFVGEFSGATVSVTRAVHVPQALAAARMLHTWDDSGAPPPPPVAPGAAPVAQEPCDDLLSLEGPAMMGQLSPGQLACLEGRLKTERLQTTKNKISRLMIVNAEVMGDMGAWEVLMHRHLEDIDRSDPDLCMRYAVFLHRQKDLETAEDAVRWADVALENKQVWEGEAHVRKVGGLLRLRAEAAHRLWNDAEERYRAETTADNDRMVREYRGWAKDYSREWLDYARAAGSKTAVALELCRTAAGTEAFCAPSR